MYVARVRKPMTDGERESVDEDKDAFEGVKDGDGCAEIWERLSEKRRRERIAED